MTEIEKQYRELHDTHPTKMYDKYVYIATNYATEHDRQHPMFDLPKLKIFMECLKNATKLGSIKNFKNNVNTLLIPALRKYTIDNL